MLCWAYQGADTLQISLYPLIFIMKENSVQKQPHLADQGIYLWLQICPGLCPRWRASWILPDNIWDCGRQWNQIAGWPCLYLIRHTSKKWLIVFQSDRKALDEWLLSTPSQVQVWKPRNTNWPQVSDLKSEMSMQGVQLPGPQADECLDKLKALKVDWESLESSRDQRSELYCKMPWPKHVSFTRTRWRVMSHICTVAIRNNNAVCNL